MTFDKIKELDNKSFMPTYNRFDVAIASGTGSTLVDVEGKLYVDFASGIGVNSLGYAERDWVSAVSGQAAKLAHISNLYYNEVSTQLASKLCEHSGFDKVFLANSGAEANEGAIKLARKYSFDKYGAGRDIIITLNQSFHGRTITTISATGQEGFHNYFFPFTEGFLYCDANNIDMMKKLVSENEDRVCALMIECIQGEGGVIPLELEFVKALRNLCDKNDILLIADEIQTGVCRTGKFLACEHFNIKADVVTLAKGLGGGLPIGAVLCDKRLAGTLAAGTHGTTFGGNPIACAGANVVLNKACKPEFLAEIAEKSRYIFDFASRINGVIEVRGIGFMIGIICEQNSADIVKKCIEAGLIVLTAKNAVRLLPPLNISKEQLEKGLNILKNVIEEKAEGKGK